VGNCPDEPGIVIPSLRPRGDLRVRDVRSVQGDPEKPRSPGHPHPRFATAIGGGVIRDALLHRTPVSFTTNLYALFALLGCLSAVAWHYVAKGKRFLDEDRAFLLVDAVGLAVFAVIGASAGAAAGLKPWSVVVLAALTAAGGGAVRDLLVMEIPMMLHADFYATAALLGGLAFVLLSAAGFQPSVVSAAAFLTTLLLRTAAIYLGWSLPSCGSIPGRARVSGPRTALQCLPERLVLPDSLCLRLFAGVGDRVVMGLEQGDQGCVEFPFRRHLVEGTEGLLTRHSFAIRPVLRDRGEDVRHRHEPGPERKVVLADVERVAAAVEALLVERTPGGYEVQDLDRVQDLVRVVGVVRITPHSACVRRSRFSRISEGIASFPRSWR